MYTNSVAILLCWFAVELAISPYDYMLCPLSSGQLLPVLVTKVAGCVPIIQGHTLAWYVDVQLLFHLWLSYISVCITFFSVCCLSGSSKQKRSLLMQFACYSCGFNGLHQIHCSDDAFKAEFMRIVGGLKHEPLASASWDSFYIFNEGKTFSGQQFLQFLLPPHASQF